MLYYWLQDLKKKEIKPVISSLFSLMARGAIISMIIILFMLHAILLICEKIVIKTSKGFIDVPLEIEIKNQ